MHFCENRIDSLNTSKNDSNKSMLLYCCLVKVLNIVWLLQSRILKYAKSRLKCLKLSFKNIILQDLSRSECSFYIGLLVVIVSKQLHNYSYYWRLIVFKVIHSDCTCHGGPFMSDNLLQQLTNENWEIDQKIMAVVRDNAKNI